MATLTHHIAPDTSAGAEHRTIPFDYAFRFELEGIPGTVQNSILTVSIEASFVASSIGFGVIPETTSISLAPSFPSGPITGGSLLQFMPFLDSLARAFQEPLPSSSGTLGIKSAAAIRNGFRLDPRLAGVVLSHGVNKKLSVNNFLQVISPGSRDIQFLYALFDEGSGREFQSEPILSTAGLGTSNGERPFRHFARPIEFRPRSTIRMQITETSDFLGTLHVSLQGYKRLGGSGTPTGRIRPRLSTGRRR
jgi:hypothetical protein